MKTSKLLLIIVLAIMLQYKKSYSEENSLYKTIFSVDAVMGRNTDFITPQKVDAALNIACIASGEYYLFPPEVKDSILIKLQSDRLDATALNAARMLNADYIAFPKVDIFKNIVRTEIALRGVNDTLFYGHGVGFEIVRWKKGEEELNIYDPALVGSAQRALAVALGDTMLYANAKNEYEVYPAKPLAICGLEFIDSRSLPSWSLFEDKEVVSFDIVETMFEAARFSKEYVVLDTDTRDAIYNLFNLYMIENYTQPTVTELDALNRLGVEAFIAGSIRRNSDGAFLDIRLFHFESGNAVFQKARTGTIYSESLDETRYMITKLLVDLLDLEL